MDRTHKTLRNTVALLTALVAFLLPMLAQANTLNALRNDMIKTCADEGESKAVCTCVVDKWQASIAPNEKDNAAVFAQVMASGKQPTPSQMVAMQPMMARFGQFGVGCAMAAAEEATPDVDISQFAPGMPADQAALLNSMANGGGSSEDIISQFQAMDAKDEAERAAKRKAQQAQDAKLAQEREARKAEFEAEMQKVESRNVIKQPVSAFEKAFKLSQAVSGSQSKQTIDCLWSTLTQSAGSGPAGSLVAYFSSIGGGDFDQPQDRLPYLEEADKRTRAYTELRQKCY